MICFTVTFFKQLKWLSLSSVHCTVIFFLGVLDELLCYAYSTYILNVFTRVQLFNIHAAILAQHVLPILIVAAHSKAFRGDKSIKVPMLGNFREARQNFWVQTVSMLSSTSTKHSKMKSKLLLHSLCYAEACC